MQRFGIAHQGVQRSAEVSKDARLKIYLSNNYFSCRVRSTRRFVYYEIVPTMVQWHVK